MTTTILYSSDADIYTAFKNFMLNCPHFVITNDKADGGKFTIFGVEFTTQTYTGGTSGWTFKLGSSTVFNIKRNVQYPLVLAWDNDAIILFDRQGLKQRFCITKDVNGNLWVIFSETSGTDDVYAYSISEANRVYKPWGFTVNDSTRLGRNIIIPTYWKATNDNLLNDENILRKVYSTNKVLMPNVEFQGDIYRINDYLLFKF